MAPSQLIQIESRRVFGFGKACPLPGVSMEQPKQWRLEAYDPRKSTEWLPLREIEEDQLEAAEELRNELNKTNAPVVLRIVRKTAF
jgi:hypothetical protein